MKKPQRSPARPDIDAAVRGGDWAQGMDGEGPPARATLKQALYWSNIYTEILAMEEKVLRRIKQLMAAQTAQARREVELTNVPVVVAQAERFRRRLGYWKARLLELDGEMPRRDLTGGAKGLNRSASTGAMRREASPSSGRRQREKPRRHGKRDDVTS